MFGLGVMDSVRQSLVDLPALLLLVLATTAYHKAQSTRSTLWLALSNLTKETFLLGGFALVATSPSVHFPGFAPALRCSSPPCLPRCGRYMCSNVLALLPGAKGWGACGAILSRNLHGGASARPIPFYSSAQPVGLVRLLGGMPGGVAHDYRL